MRVKVLAAAVALAASLPFPPASAGPSIPGVQTSPQARVVLQNARVRVYRTIAGALAGVDHRPGVVVWLEEQPARAIWLDDAGVPPDGGAGRGPVVIVQPLEREATSTPPPASGPAASGRRTEAFSVGFRLRPQRLRGRPAMRNWLQPASARCSIDLISPVC